ncbi:MAG: sugar transferase [Nitrospirota bacterium]
MLRQRARIISIGVFLIDLSLTIISFFLAYFVRDRLGYINYGHLLPISEYSELLFYILPIWLIIFHYLELYKSQRTKTFLSEIEKLFIGVILGALSITTIIFGLKYIHISRLFLLIFPVIDFILLSFGRISIRIFARYVRKRGYNYRYILVIGTGKRARQIINLLKEHKHWGLRLVGIISDQSNGKREKINGYPIIGGIDNISNILEKQVVDEVVFAVSRKRLEELEDIFLLCEELGIRTRVAVNFFPKMIAKVHLEQFYNIPLLTFTTTPYNETLLALKRGFDIVVSLALLIILCPLFIIVAILIKSTSEGSVIFSQERVGLNRRRFTLYKFRSMVNDAEEKKGEVSHLNEMNGPAFKITNDPRITRFGKIIRRLSIDEFPQLINVLKGDMSIVGPRPPIPEEVEKYENWQRRRLSMKPGVTCLWQISGRNKVIDFNKWMEMDLQYIDNWSIGLDIKIFFKTIPVVFTGKGAA